MAKKAPSVSPHFVLRDKEWEKLVWHLHQKLVGELVSAYLGHRVTDIGWY
jgi:hypothetical protein